MTVLGIFVRAIEQSGYQRGEDYIESKIPLSLFALELSEDGKVFEAQLYADAASATAAAEEVEADLRERFPEALPYVGPGTRLPPPTG